GYTLQGSSRNTCSTRLALSTKSRQLSAFKKRRLPMLLLIDTWSAACFLFSAYTRPLVVSPFSERRCSIQVSGNANARPLPNNRGVSSATRELTLGGFDLTISAVTTIKFLGSFSALS